ncbi:MAG TPA: branched-chain amino acid ABC transporter permease [Microvirga sp.]|jgi:branched-chain amino acid transport system permease protein|nr:branched-chain amino acid ABC transporter permease [Microvirga sp.]
MRTVALVALAVFVAISGFFAPKLGINTYYFYAGYVVLQYVTIATAWNVLGGYGGYINFGAAAFFGAGAYTAAVLFKLFGVPLPLQILAAAAIGVALGVAMGYLTLRVQGVYFAIATLGLVVVLETIVHNVETFGGARGLTILAPRAPDWFGGQTPYVFFVMLLIAIASVAIAVWIEHSWIGRGLRAIRASENAAECSGVPTLRLKLVACAVSGGLLAAAGAPYGFYASFLEPGTAFSLAVGLNAIAMPLIGGTRSWLGPVLGAILLGSVQQITTVTISSELNILVVGLVLIAFVAAAPGGLLGLWPASRGAAR